MFKSCKYCGRIHDRKYICGKQPVKTNRNTEIDKFRSSIAWQHKREEIRERDHNLCQICIRELYNTVNRLRTTTYRYIMPCLWLMTLVSD
jgi:hypothetical protein